MAIPQLFNRNLLGDISNVDFMWICETGDIDLDKLMKYNLKLSKKTRKLLYMHYDLMMSAAEISAELGFLEGDVEILVKREVKKMAVLFNPVYVQAHLTDAGK